MSIKLLSIIVPVYNEEKTVSLILDKVLSVELTNEIQKEIIIVNDCSTDNSKIVINNYIKANTAVNILYLENDKNTGKGSAIHKGITHVKGDYFIIQDADLEYDPNEYNELLKPVLTDNADVVYGSRFKGGKPHRMLFFWHSIGNNLLTNLTNIFSNLNLSDMETCYKLIRTTLLRDLKLEEKQFGFEPEITLKLSRIPKIKIYEVGISYYGRTYEEGKKINWKDGISAIFCILKYGLLKL
jgi:glycosyltransferase involved in cell wall biosynthesis